MGEFTKEAIEMFLMNQTELMNGRVANTVHEARDFLEENMAVELSSLKEVKEFLKENDMDIAGMTDEEIIGQDEVLQLPSGRFLVIMV